MNDFYQDSLSYSQHRQDGNQDSTGGVDPMKVDEIPGNPSTWLLMKDSVGGSMDIDIIGSGDSLPFSEIHPRLQSDGLSPLRYIPANIPTEETPVPTPNYDFHSMDMRSSNSFEDIDTDSTNFGSSLDSSLRVASRIVPPDIPAVFNTAMPTKDKLAQVSTSISDPRFERVDSVLLPEDCYGASSGNSKLT